MSFTIRFDDICIQSNMAHTNAVAELFMERFENCRVIYAISPLVKKSNSELVFPKIWNALSDYRVHFQLDTFGIPEIPCWADRASHGMIHADSRLLTKEQQEMNILLSCSLTNTKIFVPPFNKWNKDTEKICEEFGIELIKWEQGWLSVEYNQYKPECDKWYLHAREMTLEQIKQWMSKK